MSSVRSGVVAALSFVSAAAMIVNLAPASAAETSATPESQPVVAGPTVTPAASLNNATCRSARKAVTAFPADWSQIDDDIITLGSWTVDFGQDRWQAGHPRVELLTRAFHSSAWLIPERIEDLGRSIELFVEQARVNPDPGATMTALALREHGWIEGHTTRRLKTALCLYRLADGEQRTMMMPAIEQLLDANLDPRRYYGPPLNPAHNHGLMADRELLNAARHLKRPDLAEAAVDRLQLQKADMYDACGFNYEQASSYQFLHASLWRQLLRRIDVPAFAERIERTVQTITEASNSLAFPDGGIPAIGDGRHRTIDDLSLVSAPTRLWCPETGWSSRRTSRSGITQQLITRFGPATNFHGHSDKGSFAWWVGQESAGVPVITDRGTPPKTKPKLVDRLRSAESHTVFDWRGASDRRTTASSRRSNGRETLTITTQRGDWTRSITSTPKQRVLRVEDQVSVGESAGRARSYLQLDPVWQRTSNGQTFRTDSGWRLQVRCTDSSGDRLPMTTDNVTDFQQNLQRPALRVTCSVRDASRGITATLKVTPPRAR